LSIEAAPGEMVSSISIGKDTINFGDKDLPPLGSANNTPYTVLWLPSKGYTTCCDWKWISYGRLSLENC